MSEPAPPLPAAPSPATPVPGATSPVTLMPAAPQTAGRPDPAARPSRMALLGWAVFVLLVLYTVLLGGGWAGIYVVSLRVFSLALIAAGLAVWLLLAWRRPEWRPRSAIWPAFAAPLLALTLATILSDRPRQGLEYVAWAVLLTALYLLLARVLAMPTAQARIGGLAAGLGLGLGIVYLAVVVVAWIEWWGLVGRVVAPPLRPVYAGLTYGNPSAVLTVQVLLAVVAYAGLGLGNRARQTVLLVLGVVTLLVILLSGSRAGWLAVAGAVLLVGMAWLLVGEHRGLVGRALRRRRVRRALWVVAAVGLVAGVVLLPGIAERTMGGGDGGRLSYFAAAWRMFAEDPIAGKGPGMWAPLRATYTEPGETDYYITHAHNIYLHTLAETGLLGLAAGVVVVACLAWLFVRAVRSADPARRRWAWWGLLALVYMALHDMLDYYANMPSVLVLLAVPVAMLDAMSDRSIGLAGLAPKARELAARAAAIGFAGLCLISLLGLVRAEAVALDHDEAVRQIGQGEWDLAAPFADAALSADPDVPAYQVTRALVAAHERDWPTAELLFGEAAATDDLPQSWLGLALAGMRAWPARRVGGPGARARPSPGHPAACRQLRRGGAVRPHRAGRRGRGRLRRRPHPRFQPGWRSVVDDRPRPVGPLRRHSCARRGGQPGRRLASLSHGRGRRPSQGRGRGGRRVPSGSSTPGPGMPTHWKLAGCRARRPHERVAPRIGRRAPAGTQATKSRRPPSGGSPATSPWAPTSRATTLASAITPRASTLRPAR